MKRIFGFALMLALLSIPALAAKNSQSLNIMDTVTVGNTQLPAAEYKVTWTATGDNAQVTLTHGKTTVTVPAKIVAEKHDFAGILTNSQGGSSVLEAIRLSNVSLVLTAAPHAGQ
jgi:hypothetical protein